MMNHSRVCIFAGPWSKCVRNELGSSWESGLNRCIVRDHVLELIRIHLGSRPLGSWNKLRRE